MSDLVRNEFEKQLVSPFFTILFVAMILCIIAFVTFIGFTESTRTAAEHMVQQRENPNLSTSEKRLLNIHDTITYYDRMVRN